MNTEGKVTYEYIVYIQFEESKKAYTFGSNVKYYTNDIVVVETVRGQELGKVCVPTVDLDASKVKGDIKPVLLSLIHISEPTRLISVSRMPSSA